MNMHSIRLLLPIAVLAVCTGVAMPDDLADSLVFHSSFDSTTADAGHGDRQIYTAATLERKTVSAGLPDHVELVDGGRWGKCLRFRDVSPQVVMFRAAKNIPYSGDGFSMSASFWMRVDPEKGLKPGYVDPLQITDKKWNDASLFVDFTKDETPRHFRLGVFPDFKHWNPEGTKWDDVPEEQRPLVTERKHPFGGDRWTHVVLTLDKLNSGKADGTACMYLNGQLVGCMNRDIRMTWDINKVAIMLGIQYIGDLDELAVFDRALSAEEAGRLFKAEGGIGSLR